jgi:hypothetical protein
MSQNSKCWTEMLLFQNYVTGNNKTYAGHHATAGFCVETREY